jgi:hypothetical protein
MISVLEKPRLVKTETRCWRCRTKIPVVSIAVSKFKDDSVNCNFPTFLEFVLHMPEELKVKIQEQCPDYYFSYSYMAEISYYANHCSRCRSMQGDFFIHYEVDGPFLADSRKNRAPWFEVIALDVQVPFQADCSYGTGGDDAFWQRLGLKEAAAGDRNDKTFGLNKKEGKK